MVCLRAQFLVQFSFPSTPHLSALSFLPILVFIITSTLMILKYTSPLTPPTPPHLSHYSKTVHLTSTSSRGSAQINFQLIPTRRNTFYWIQKTRPLPRLSHLAPLLSPLLTTRKI